MVERDIPVRMRDGVRLATDVYRRAGDAKAPAIVLRTPYGRDVPALVNIWMNALRAAACGWVVVVQDVRGRFGSEGDFEPFAFEGPDGADTVAWVRAQPWCTGQVFMSGGSYVGLTQWAAAATAPEGLVAIAPAVTAHDVLDAWIREDGVVQKGFLLTWVTGSLAPDPELAAALDRMLREPIDIGTKLGKVAPYVAGWLAHEPDDDYWRTRVPDLQSVPVPAMIVTGWYDIFVKGALRDFAALAARRSGDRLVVGPWAHGATGGWYPHKAFPGGSLDAIDPTGLQLDWFRGLLDGAAPPARPVRLYVMGLNRWHDFDAWPPAEASSVRLAVPPSEALTSNPDDPVPTIGGRTYLPGLFIAANAGPRDQRALEERQDVRCHTFPPEPDPVVLVGPITLSLTVSSSASTPLVATLTIVDADGRSESLSSGAARVEAGLDRTVEVDLGGIAALVPGGHRLRLDLALQDSPRLAHDTDSVTVTIGGGELRLWRLPGSLGA